MTTGHDDPGSPVEDEEDFLADLRALVEATAVAAFDAAFEPALRKSQTRLQRAVQEARKDQAASADGLRGHVSESADLVRADIAELRGLADRTDAQLDAAKKEILRSIADGLQQAGQRSAARARATDSLLEEAKRAIEHSAKANERSSRALASDLGRVTLLGLSTVVLALAAVVLAAVLVARGAA